VIYSRYSQRPLVGKSWVPAFTYQLDQGVVALKLAVNVRSEENEALELLQGPIILEVTEDPQHVYEGTSFSEQYCELGFWSKTFATPITGWRIKVPEGAVLPGLVDMVAYG
jgi:hypothetical protein